MLFICPKCSTEQDALSAKIEKHFLPNGGYHLKALCYQCGFFIKNLPHSLPQILHFCKLEKADSEHSQRSFSL